MSSIGYVTSGNFTSEVVESPVPVLVDFYADWCMPCRMLSPALQALSERFQGRVKIVKVDVDRDVGLARSYGITAIPTLKLFERGKVRETIQGLRPPESLAGMLEKVTANGAFAPR